MSITFACEHCGRSFTMDDKFDGKQGKCQQCGAVLPIPQAGQAPSTLAIDDISGFEFRPSPTHHALPEGVEELPHGSRKSNRFEVDQDDEFAPPMKKKGSRTGLGMAVRVALLAFAGLIGIGAIVAVAFVRTREVPSSRKELEKNIHDRIELNQQLATLLEGVNDVAGAQAASTRAIRGVKAITANLRKLKRSEGQKADLAQIKQQFQALQEQASKQVVQQMLRVVTIEGAWDALNVKSAIEELDREEKAVDLAQVQPLALPVVAPIQPAEGPVPAVPVADPAPVPVVGPVAPQKANPPKNNRSRMPRRKNQDRTNANAAPPG